MVPAPARRVAVPFVAAALLLAGAVVPGLSAAAVDPVPVSGNSTTANGESPPDPEEDVLGWEGGYWHDESIAVDRSDGLNDSELDAYVSRAMARVEELRQREFTADVPVTVESRAEYRERTRSDGDDDPSAYERWNDQVWEALFVVGEDRGSGGAIGEARGESVVGFYDGSAGEIRIVVPSDADATIDRGTLVHELVHALQDQYGVLGRASLRARTQDERLATDAVVEGEANYVERLYERRCDETWDCVDSPSTGGDGSNGDGGASTNFGVSLTLYFPYSDGPPYVASLHEAGGWDAVERAYDRPPNSTEQVIHRTEEAPGPIAVETAPRNGWERFPEQGVDGAETVGEASIFVMVWYQSYASRADVVDPGTIRTDDPLDGYDYAAAPSTGWANDRLVPYRDDGEYGYVWTTEWDTEADAREFHDAYLRILDAHDAVRRGRYTRVIERGSFADAFHVVRNGTTVTVVNAPTAADLRDVRPAAPTGPAPVDVRAIGVRATLAALALVSLAVCWSQWGRTDRPDGSDGGERR